MAGRLSDEEKRKLIVFYKENPPLWDGNNVYYKNKLKKETIKAKLLLHFNNKYEVDQLDKSFHSLRTSFMRELKKIAQHEESNERDVPLKKWKFMDDMEFLLQEINRDKKKTDFNESELEDLIEFYRENPGLWNHLSRDWRDRDLKGALMEKLKGQYNGKFSIEEIKQAWHNTLSHYKSEKLREEASRTKSGSSLGEVYISTWTHFNSMEFVDVTCDMDRTENTIDSPGESDSELPPPPPRKKSKAQEKEEERMAKTELYRSLIKQLSAQPQSQVVQTQPSNSSLESRANLIGKLVADNLLQYDPKDWTYLKKKIMDLFFDYEQEKANLTNQTYEFSQGNQEESYTALLQSHELAGNNSNFS